MANEEEDDEEKRERERERERERVVARRRRILKPNLLRGERRERCKHKKLPSEN